MGPYAVGDPPWMIEIVAGIIEDGESPADVARREAREEAGLTIGELTEIGSFYASPGAMTERATMFCGRANAADAGGLHGLDHEGEDIRALAVPARELGSLMGDGRVRNLITATALQWLLLHREGLRGRWDSAG